MTWEGLSPPYSTIVADPPWPYPEVRTAPAYIEVKPFVNKWWEVK